MTLLVHASLRHDVELRDHQIKGVNRMIHLEKSQRGGILADDVSGKGLYCDIHRADPMPFFFSLRVDGIGKGNYKLHTATLSVEYNLYY